MLVKIGSNKYISGVATKDSYSFGYVQWYGSALPSYYYVTYISSGKIYQNSTDAIVVTDNVFEL